ncbi:MAG: tyrosine-protein phosphatase [Pseudomonadota bacterium]|nr:tyrosine-protein phosphatase [Pseudomonadota bacterium]
MKNQHSSKANWALVAHENGWQISPPVSVDLNDYQFYLEWCAGQSFSPALALPEISDAVLSFNALSALVDDEVDALAHPILSVKNNHTGSILIRVACRHLPMSATANFRDYGGYLTQSGRQVMWGKLFRTGHMGEMNDRDIAVLSQLNIRAVCDFRRPEEAAKQPSLLPQGLRPTAIPISPGSAIDFFSAISEQAIDEAKIDAFMQDINHDLVINHQPSYRAMFDQLLASADAGSIIHCSAGKDRTGFGGLLMLSALGVSDDDIMADYLLTNQYVNIEREIARWTVNYGTDQTKIGIADSDKVKAAREAINAHQGEFTHQALAVILKVKASYLQTAVDTIREEFGSTISYLEQQIGLSSSELSRLKAAYLYE